MRTPFLLASLGLAISFAWLGQAFSQAPQVAPTTGINQAGVQATKFGIAVVDVAYIFKRYERFNALMASMKTEVDKAGETLEARRTSITQQQEKLAQMTPGSADYKALDDEVSRLKAEFNLQATKQQKEFLERESKIYFQTYQEVSDAVSRYAKSRNIGLVLRFNGDPPDPNNIEDVRREISKPVVFQNFIDITPDIEAELNRSAGVPQASLPSNPIPGRPR